MANGNAPSAATAPPTTTTPAEQATGTSLLSILQGIAAFITDPNHDPTVIAEILGVWTAARAAVSTVASGIAAAAVQTAINKAMAQYQDVPLSGAALALMVIKNVLPDSTGTVGAPANYPPAYMPGGVNGGTATQEASLTGISGDRFAAMVLANGESYGLIDALRLLNRQGNIFNWEEAPTYSTGTPLYQAGGDLSPEYAIQLAEFYKVAAYSNIRPEFIPDLFKLQHDTLSPADAVELAVKEVISVDDARTLYAAAGGMPEQFSLLYRGAGDSAGLEHATELLAHGVITQGRMNQIIGMSRLNPDFYDLYSQGANGVIPMHQKWLPVFELGRMVEVGLMTQAEAITYMTQQGYSTADSTMFFQAAQLARVVSIRGASESQIAEDWQAGLITQAQAVEALTNLGYQSWAIPIILDTYEARKVISARNNVVTRTRSAVLVGGVSSAEAVADLESVGFSAPAAQEMVADWTVEANTPTKTMPYSVVGFLLQGGIMGTTDGINYFRRSGYSEQDAEMMTRYYQSGIPTPETTVSGTPGPLEEETPAPIPPAPTRVPISELGPPKPTA
jgi:hypothetical protein